MLVRGEPVVEASRIRLGGLPPPSGSLSLFTQALPKSSRDINMLWISCGEDPRAWGERLFA